MSLKSKDVNVRYNGIQLTQSRNNVNHWDADGLTIPRQFRAGRFPNCSISFLVEHDGPAKGRQPYWWNCHE